MKWMHPLLKWYKENARDLPWRQTRDPYRIWVSEIMLQQTRVQAVIGYYERFLAAFPNIASLAGADDARLLKQWEGLGYYSRARNLKKAAAVVTEQFGGALPKSYAQLLNLPGFGEYTAGAVASIAFSLPVAAVDGNVLRVWARLNDLHEDITAPALRRCVRDALTAAIPKDAPGTFNQAMMELGATVCLPNGQPHCDTCPILAYCRAVSAGTAQSLPVRTKKPPRRIEFKTVFVLETPDGCLGYQRKASGLLASMWQLPEAEGMLCAEDAAAMLSAWGLSPAGEVSFYERRHIFTHIEWRMLVCRARVLGAVPEGMCVLTQAHALPSAYRVCLT